jgi:iron-sulfur cluster assembly accessory protein
LAKDEELVGHGLRIKVIGGGCSGLRYNLLFDDKVSENDLVMEFEGVEIIIDENSASYLQGSKLDYLDTLNESGFKFTNPNATSCCGCGESFGC